VGLIIRYFFICKVAVSSHSYFTNKEVFDNQTHSYFTNKDVSDNQTHSYFINKEVFENQTHNLK
jgi:hypothetical protein